jgi:hypothetical protein
MRIHRRVSVLACSILVGTLFSCFNPLPASAGPTLFSLLPPSERSIFILDVSGSTNSTQLWKTSLRPSLVKKLGQPFGVPTQKGLDKVTAPMDVTVSVINAQSMDAPIFPIVSLKDAEKMWGLIDKVGEKPTSKRLELIMQDIFGGQGAFTQQVSVLARPKVVVPVASTCEKSVINSFKTAAYMNDLDPIRKSDAAKTICGLVISMAKRLLLADQYFAKSECGVASPCSDIVGAILRVTDSASDLYAGNPKSKLCIAIASDMLHFSAGMASSSPLDTRRVVMNAKSPSDAKLIGAKAARVVGINFPQNMPIRVTVLGQGSGPDPIPLEKNAILTGYWEGFWEASGVKNSSQVRSLDQACS